MKKHLWLTLQLGAIYLAMVVTLAGVAALTIRTRGQEDLRAFEESEMEEVRQHLKDLVDVAYATVQSHFAKATDLAYLERVYGARLKTVSGLAEAILAHHAARVREGAVSLERAQAEAHQELKRQRYDGGEGYLWVFRKEGDRYVTLLNSAHPEEEGPVSSTDTRYLCARGRGEFLLQALANAAAADGFVDYVWPKPGSAQSVPKLAHVRYFREWDWYVGTGAYIDEALRAARIRAVEDLRTMRYDNTTGYFWVNDTARPVPRMVMHPIKPETEGHVLDAPENNCAEPNNENLFVAAARVATEKGSGFIRYKYDKPTPDGIARKVPKVSCVRYHSGFDWVIGSGAYIDDVQAAIDARAAALAEEQDGAVLNVLLSALAAGLAGFLLLFLVIRRYASTVARSQHLEREVERELSALSARGDARGVEAPPAPRSADAAGADALAAARDLLRVVLEEQTKMQAFQAVVAQARPREGQELPGALAEQVKALHKAVAEQARMIEELTSENDPER